MSRVKKRSSNTQSNDNRRIFDFAKPWDTYWNERRHNEDKTNDNRTPAQRDYARVIHSSAFRRLQRKTQVFGLGDSDFYRTRLTHSLEVSQIGEGITRNLRRNSRKGRIFPESEQIRAICLAHDLGHPPFGHGGERALNKIMFKYNGFEGNGQSLRIMASLPSYHKKHGMNLSRRTLLGVIKYPASYSDTVNMKVYPKENILESPANRFKPPKCYLDEEEDTINWIKERVRNDWNIISTVNRDNREKHYETKYKSLDASILEIADDIAYGVHDLEDAIALRFVKRSDFENSVSKSLLTQCFKPIQSLRYKRFLDSLFCEESTNRKWAIGRLVSCFVGSVYLDSIEETGLKHSIFFMNAAMPKAHKDLLEILKNIVFENVIKTVKVQQLEYKGKMIIAKLFDAFKNDPENLLPKDQYERYCCDKNEEYQMRVICDYIAGMTDDYAIRRYQQMFTPNVGSVFDHLG